VNERHGERFLCLRLDTSDPPVISISNRN
jgi:hypothetical protein